MGEKTNNVKNLKKTKGNYAHHQYLQKEYLFTTILGQKYIFITYQSDATSTKRTEQPCETFSSIVQ